MSSNKGKPGAKGSSKKQPSAPKTSPRSEASSSANGDCRDGLYRCDACNKGYIRGSGSLSIHQKRLCPVLARRNLFDCDVCGLGFFRGRSSLDLHKRKLCKGVWREKYPEADDSDFEVGLEADEASFNGRVAADDSDDGKSNLASNYFEGRNEEDMDDECQVDDDGDDDNDDDGDDNNVGACENDEGDVHDANGDDDDDDDEEFFKTY